MPGIAVVTIGLSPAPAVLSVRAIRPERVVLICSEQTSSVADRIQAMIESDGVSVDNLVCGPGVDFAQTYQRTWKGLSDLGVTSPFLLDYTGGTSAMVAVVVAIHQRLHLEAEGCDRPDLRVYQNESDGVLVSDTGHRFALNAALTVSEMAQLHGFGISTVRRSPSPAVEWGDDPVWAHALGDRSRWGGRTVSTLDRLRSALTVLFEQYTDPGCESLQDLTQVWTDDDSSSNRAGKAMELVVLAAVLCQDWDEVVFNCAVRRLDLPYTDPGSEFDVIVRRGHQVVVLEVKSSLGNLVKTAGRRLAAAKAVFGGATRVLSVSSKAKHDTDADAPGGLAEIEGQWEPVLATLGRWRSHLIEDQADMATVASAALDFLPPTADVSGFAWPPGPSVRTSGESMPEPSADASMAIPAPVRSRPLVAALGGSPLAVDNVLAMTAASATLLGRRDAVHAYRAHLAARGKQLPVMHHVDGLDARSIASACGRFSAGTLAVTPSTKSVTAGMTASAGQGDHDLLHVDIMSGMAMSWRHGCWPHRNEVRWSSVSNPVYGTVGGEQWWSRLEEAGHTNVVALKAFLRALPIPERAVVRYSPMPEVSWLVPILVTGAWRAIGVAVPAGVGKDDRSAVLACDQHIASMVGDIGRLLVALPASQSPAGTRHLWNGWLRRSPAPLFAFWRAKNPRTVEFDEDEVSWWLS